MSTIPMCDESRNARQLEPGTCLMCGRAVPVDGRSTYCTPACRQRAFRIRHRPMRQPRLIYLTKTLRRECRLTAQTVYECPSCSEHLLGERRCDDCNLMCRKVGLGGRCSGCDEILTVIDLVGLEHEGGDAAS